MYICMYNLIYIYIYTYTCIHIHTYSICYWIPFGDHPLNWNYAEKISMAPAQG